MNNVLIKLLLPIFSFLLFVGCDNIRGKEINLGLNEVLVYYDSESDSYKVLENGNHKFATEYFYSRFSLEDLQIQEKLIVLTKDKKEVLIDLTYWYAFKKKGVIQLHEKYGGRIEETLLLPTIRSVVRNEIKNMISDSLNNEELKISLLKNINNLNDYSELIDSKSFIITELKIEN
jgi:hypothetical protein